MLILSISLKSMIKQLGHLLDVAYTIRLCGEEGILTKPLIMSK